MRITKDICQSSPVTPQTANPIHTTCRLTFVIIGLVGISLLKFNTTCVIGAITIVIAMCGYPTFEFFLAMQQNQKNDIQQICQRHRDLLAYGLVAIIAIFTFLLVFPIAQRVEMQSQYSTAHSSAAFER